MAMTISEASATNTLLRYLFGETGYVSGGAVSPEDARAAAITLAKSANARLGAGYTESTAAIAWDANVPQPATQTPS